MKDAGLTNAKKWVLVADDAPEIAGRVVDLVSSFDNLEPIGPARDGHEAWELFQKTAPDMVVLDFHMPGLTGLEVLQQIRQRDGDCVVVVMTSSNERQIVVRCLTAGADYFVSKSAMQDRLPEILRKFATAA